MVEVMDVNATEEKALEMKSKGQVLINEASMITVSSKEEFDTARDFVEVVMAEKKVRTEYFKPLLDKAKELKAVAEANRKGIANKEAEAIAPLDEAIKNVRPKMLAYQEEEDRKARERQDAIDKAAREIADKQKLDDAVAAEAEGDTERAEQILDQPTQVAPVQAKREDLNLGRTGARKVWSARIVDKTKIPMAYLLPDMVTLNALARAQKENMVIPGVIADWKST